MKKSYLGILLLGISTLVACSQDDMQEQEVSNNVATSARIANGKIPFTVENVQNALPIVLRYYDSYNPTVSQKFRNYKVEPTHVYYKFTPADSLQYSLLMSYDEQLGLTTQPFEHEIIERKDDPSDTEIGTFYAIASIDQKIPEVPTQKIAELHFTDEDKLEDVPSNYDEVEFKQNLMYQARKQAGHLDDEELKEGYMSYKEGINDKANGDQRTTYGLFGKKWRPSGNVYVEEDIVRTNNSRNFHTEPVKRARVNVLKWGWLQIEHGTTNHDGYFTTGTTYTKNVNYVVKFKHDYVTVKDGNFFDTASWFSWSCNRTALNITFTRANYENYQFFALVHNASFDYYDRCLDQYDLHDPGNLNITAQINGSGSNATAQWYPFNSAIRVSKKGNNIYRGSDGIYSTTVHELTHCGHRKMDPGMFSLFHLGNKERLVITESWADGVETILTNDRYISMFASEGYGNYRSTNSFNEDVLIRTWNGIKQNRTQEEMNAYTPLVADLVDNFNQRTQLGNNALPNDLVSGYTLGEIQSALDNSRTFEQWKTKLENNYNNNTEVFLNNVFDYAIFSMYNHQNWPNN